MRVRYGDVPDRHRGFLRWVAWKSYMNFIPRFVPVFGSTKVSLNGISLNKVNA